MRRLAVCLAFVVVSACGGGSRTPIAPTPPPPANIAGGWSGTLESSNFGIHSVLAQFTQTSATVTGTWASMTLGGGSSGNFTGTTDVSSFTGIMTLSAPSTAGGVCTGTASIAGPASSSLATLRWTSVGFTGTCTGMPLNVVLALQRR